MYIERTLTVEDCTYSEQALLGIGAVFIVLAEPGAGKSDLLGEFARLLETRSMRASIFRHRAAPQGPGLVIDAMDEVARTDPAAVDAIVATAADLGRHTTVFAGRSSEWDQSRTAFVEDCFGVKPVIVRLRPFTEAEQRQLFDAAFPGLAFEDFHAEVRRIDLGILLGNPQFLQLLGEAYIESGHVFTSKAGIFADATQRLAHEANTRLRTAGRPPRDRILAAGDEIFAKLLLSGAAGITTVESLGDRDYPFLPSIAGPNGSFVLDTRLVKPGDGDDRHEPVHRIVAEYCGARYLTRRVEDSGDGLSLPRLLSIIAPSGAVRTELRGLVGWMAALGREVTQCAMIDLDSYAVLANGDPAQLTPRAKHHLIAGLSEVSQNDPYFRRGDVWRRFNISGFFTEDVRSAVSAILDPTAPDGPLRDLVLELVASSEVGAMFVPDLERISLAVPLGRGARKGAYATLVEADAGRALALAPALIAEASSTSLDLAAHAVMEFGAVRVGLAQLLALLRQAAALYPTDDGPRDREAERRYFIKTMISSLDAQTLRSALDDLTKGLVCICAPRQRWRCRCRIGISKVVGALLDRYFDIAVGPHEPDRVWRWLRPLHFYQRRGGDSSASVRFLTEDHGLRLAVQWLAISGHPTLEATQEAVIDVSMSTSHAGMHFHADDYAALSTRAKNAGNHVLWQCLLVSHNRYNTEQRSSPIRTLQRAHALNDPALMRIWALRERKLRLMRKQDDAGLRFRRGRWERRDAQVRADNYAHFLENREAIANGLFGWWTGHFARMLLIEPDQLAAMPYGTTPVDALRNCLPHVMRQAPSLSELSGGTGSEVAQVLFAHCLIRFRDGAALSDLDPAVLCVAYTESGSWPVFKDNDAEEAEFDAALEAAVFADPATAGVFVADYIEPALSSTEDKPTNVDWLRRKPTFADFLAEQPLEWLERYPFMPVNAMETLFEMAVLHGDRARLVELIDARFLDPVADSGEDTPQDQYATRRHRIWALHSFFFATPALELAWAELRQDPSVVLDLQDRVGWLGGREDSYLPPLSPESIYRILDTFVAAWPPVPLPSSYGTGSPREERAFRFFKEIIWKIGRGEPDRALPVLEAMLADARFAVFRAQLLTLRAETLHALALRDFTAPTPAQITAMLDRNHVATVEDLRALLVEELAALQTWLRGSETDPLDTFYTGGEHVDENTGRNRIVDRLSARMTALGLPVVIERHMADGNRCDITVSAALPGTHRLLVIEVKGQWNAELYTAASAQLAERYAIHPDAAGQGIFLVFWYGPDVSVAGRMTTGIASADALRDAIVVQVPESLRTLIDVVVLDVSRAAATAAPAVRVRRRTNG
ncbi:hypothetical protein [Aminobacter sp. Piv2-1]|uniref:hypothetical protein n=1 Tax=Aminobacter sp. Piv2-1 TaxID=3031122 RepID=UPI00309F822A